MVSVSKGLVASYRGSNSKVSFKRRFIYTIRYVWSYFYHYLVSILFFTIALAYYIVCIFCRYDVIFGNSFHNLVSGSYESFSLKEVPVFNLCKPSGKLDCLNYVNYLIDNNMYNEAIRYIDKIKSLLLVDSSLYRALSVRQGLLLFKVAKCAKTYETMLRGTCKGLDSNMILYLVSLYNKYISV